MGVVLNEESVAYMGCTRRSLHNDLRRKYASYAVHDSFLNTEKSQAIQQSHRLGSEQNQLVMHSKTGRRYCFLLYPRATLLYTLLGGGGNLRSKTSFLEQYLRQLNKPVHMA